MPPGQAGDHHLIAGVMKPCHRRQGQRGRANNQVVREQVQEVYGLVVNEIDHK